VFNAEKSSLELDTEATLDLNIDIELTRLRTELLRTLSQ
jgi:hypothetical protein